MYSLNKGNMYKMGGRKINMGGAEIAAKKHRQTENSFIYIYVFIPSSYDISLNFDRKTGIKSLTVERMTL